MPADTDMGGAGVVAPQFGTLADATLTDQLAQNRAEIDRARKQYAEKSEAEAAALRKSAEAQRPALQAAQTALATPRPEPPAPPEVAPPPSRKLTDFLAPVAGESPENTITKLIQGVGLMAAGIVGLKHGDARAALAGLHGALAGWQEGDKERADRAFADWDAASKRIVDDWTRRHKVYRDALENHDLTISDRVEAARLKAIEEGNDVAIKAFETREMGAALGFLQEDQKQLLHFQEQRERLKEQREMKVMQLGLQEQIAASTAQYHQALIADKAQAREQQAQNKLDAAAARKDEKNEKKAQGNYYDFATGGVREISLGQWEENNERITRGQPPLYKHVTPQAEQLIERLSVAPPILDRLDELINKINTAAPGQNITQGLINKLKSKAGISADIQEITTLNLDNALENAAALSGGQPRIAILQMIRGEATPNLSMTADVAHRAVQTTRTTIANRLAKTTGDPDAYNKASQGLTRYGQERPKKLDLGDGIKIERLPD